MRIIIKAIIRHSNFAYSVFKSIVVIGKILFVMLMYGFIKCYFAVALYAIMRYKLFKGSRQTNNSCVP